MVSIVQVPASQGIDEEVERETVLVNKDILYKEGRRRGEQRRREQQRRREYQDGRRRRYWPTQRGWEVCLLDISCQDGLQLTPADACPQELWRLPTCEGPGFRTGDFCVASKGQCLIPENLQNCQDNVGVPFSVYRKGNATATTSITSELYNDIPEDDEESGLSQVIVVFIVVVIMVGFLVALAAVAFRDLKDGHVDQARAEQS